MELQAPKHETRRDRYGRYLVLPPEGGKPRAYTRATTIAKTLDDTSNLEKWSTRMVALGLAKRPDLLAQVATLPDDDRKALNAVCEKAKEAGGATVRRDLGTAIHTMFEQSCADPNYTAPAPYDADIAAIHQALAVAGLQLVGMHERMVVNDRHEIAGTLDLLIRDRAGKLIVADLKTGSSVKYGALGYAVQLAIYATADALYTQGDAPDGSTDIREPMPPIDQALGLIIHCEPGSARCDLYWIDLTTGRAALELAMKVRTIRKMDPLVPVTLTPAETLAAVDAVFPGTVDVTEHVDDTWRAWMRGRIETLAEAMLLDTLAAAWPADLPTLGSGDPITTSQGERIAELVANIEREGGLNFPPPQPGKQLVEPRPTVAAYTPPDEGGEIEYGLQNDLNMRAGALDKAGQEWLLKILTACKAAGRDVRLSKAGATPTVRKLAICEALVDVAAYADTELLRTLITIATGDETRTAATIGRAVGQLTIEEANRLRKLAQGIDTLELTVAYGDDGSVSILGDINAAVAA